MNIKARVKKLEQKHGLEFDMNNPLNEWSTPKLVTYMKLQDPEYELPDLSNLSINELRAMRENHLCTQH